MSIFMLCSLVFLVTVGTTIAGNTDYGILEYAIQTPTVVDGMWTSPDEWTDSPITDMTGNATGQFGYNIDFGTYGLHWLVEIFTDNTTDEGDYWQICFDDQNTGGSAPDSGDFMIEIVGHTTMTVYQGNGAGWTEVTPDAGEITWSNTIDASPLNATPHWILEVVESDKTSGSVGIPTQPPTGMRIAAYDANTSTLATWAPDSSADVPDSWGAITGFSQEPIPEGLTFGVMAVISSVALLAGSHYLRKRAKLEE
ncbi:MAG: hypothetical protein CW716_08615 [Candidatus Bathyarchaeum sp.]|nr:MAG: hypothetical protein CW716_08615 [Candidatus Bathyarchaeum sp.]